jgi:hypothetical protein
MEQALVLNAASKSPGSLVLMWSSILISPSLQQEMLRQREFPQTDWKEWDLNRLIRRNIVIS